MAIETSVVHASAGALVRGPLEFTEEQRQMIRDTYANGASDAEFAVLLEISKQRRLNPLLRQIHYVSRWDSEKRRPVWSVQVSIDGLRAIAERTGLYHGQDKPVFTHADDGRLLYAEVSVWRRDWPRPAVGIAYWDEYVQTHKDRNSNEERVSRMWARMPHVMLAKVAEALALRKAFPEDMGGLYTGDEIADTNVIDAVQERENFGPHAETRTLQLRSPALDFVSANLGEITSPEQAARLYFDAADTHGFGSPESGLHDAARKLLVEHLENKGHKTVKSKLNALLRQGRPPAGTQAQETIVTTQVAESSGSLTREEKLIEEFHASVDAAKSLDALVNAWRKHREDVAELLSAEEKAAAWKFAVQAASALEPPVTKAGLLAAVRRADNPTDEPPKGKRATKDAPANVQGSATPVAPVTAPQARVLRVEVDEATFAEAKARDFSAQSDKHAWALRLHRARNWKEMIAAYAKRWDLFERRMLAPARLDAVITEVARWHGTDEASAEKLVLAELQRQSPRKKVA